MAEAKNLAEKVYFVATGIRLHVKEYILRFTGFFDRYDYCIAFPSVQEGLKAEKLIKGFKAVSIPVPDEIFEGCGVGILVKKEDKDRLLKHLKESGILVSGVFKKKNGTFVEEKE